jgi:hypothetical protein
MMAPSRSATVAEREGPTKEAVMYHSAKDLHRQFHSQRSEVLNTVADYRFLAPARLAARERLGADLARHAALRDGGAPPPARPGVTRQWLGARLVRLGIWLGGVAAPQFGNRLAPEVGGGE